MRINLGKTGPSLSLGKRGSGMSMTFGKKGTYLNTGLVGTGLSYRTRVDKFRHLKSKNHEPRVGFSTNEKPLDDVLQSLQSKSAGMVMIFTLVGLLLIIFSWEIGLLLMLSTLVYAAWDMNTPRAKARRKVLQARKSLFVDIEKAATQVQQAYDFFPHPGFIPYMVELFFLSNQFRSVVKYAQQNTNLSFYHLDLVAKALVELGQDKEALEKLKMLHQMAGNKDEQEEIMFLKAQLYAKQGDWVNAIALLQQIRPNRLSAFYRESALLRAHCMVEAGMPKEALELLEEIIGKRRNLEDDEKELLYQMAHYSRQLGETNKSHRYIKRLINMDIRYKDAWELWKTWESTDKQ